MAESVRIERLAAGGDGVGHLPDGLTVFVPRTAPGDLVGVRDVQRRRRHAFALVDSVLEPGPERVEPRCAHFVRDGCGGCQWQHLELGAQLRAKARIVGDALRRIGKLAVPDPQLVPSSLVFGYRGTVTLAVHGHGGRRTVGLHRGGDARVFQLERCEIAREPLNALWAALSGWVGALPAGDDIRVVLRVTPGDALHVLVRGGERAWAGGPALAAAASVAGLVPTVWWQPEGGAERRMAGPEADPAAVTFEQVNAGVAAALRSDLVDAVPHGAARVLDLYAGAGEVGLELAARGAEVVTVELDHRAVRWTEARAAERGLQVRTVAGKVEDAIRGLVPADTVIVNPPRTGLEPAVAAVLRAAPPRRLLYVSCDPATLARDLARLGATPDRLTLVRAYDMFPQTSHAETLVALDRDDCPDAVRRLGAGMVRRDS
jgi:23S rRNA (uracil1939-C5)-methyltransferase